MSVLTPKGDNHRIENRPLTTKKGRYKAHRSSIATLRCSGLLTHLCGSKRCGQEGRGVEVSVADASEATT